MRPFNYVNKMTSCTFQNIINKTFVEIIYSINMYENELALYNLRWLICQKQTKPNQVTQENSFSLLEEIIQDFSIIIKSNSVNQDNTNIAPIKIKLIVEVVFYHQDFTY